MTLSVESLYSMDDSTVKIVVQGMVQAQVTTAPPVSLFFPKAGADASIVPAWNSKVAIGLVCSSIGRTALYGFSNTVSQSASDAFWQNLLSDTNADAITTSQTLYDTYFPLYCFNGDGQFSAYLNDESTSHWGSQLASYLQDSAFINTTILKIIDDDPNWLQIVNLALYKVHRLDSSLVSGIVSAWQSAAPSAGVVANWQSYSYLPSTMFQPDGFLSQVDAQINVATNQQLGYSGEMTTYGKKVVEFLQAVPSSYGIVTNALGASNVIQ